MQIVNKAVSKYDDNGIKFREVKLDAKSAFNVLYGKVFADKWIRYHPMSHGRFQGTPVYLFMASALARYHLNQFIR